MSESISKTIDDGGPAFPHDEFTKDGNHFKCHPGMSLRDWFAGQALAGFMAVPDYRMYQNDCGKSVAEWRSELNAGDCNFMYDVADAMLNAREKA